MAKRIFLLLMIMGHFSGRSQNMNFSVAPGSPINSHTNLRGLTVTDLNGDGIKDFVVGNGMNSSVVHIRLGTGTGSFIAAPGSPLNYPGGPIYFTVADLNGDNFKDLAGANYFSGGVSVWLGTGTGSFTQASGSPISTGPYSYCIASADFNSDGFTDLVSCSATTDNIYLLLGNGTGSFTLASGFPMLVGSMPYHVSAAKFNNDNFTDIAVANGNSNNITVLLGNGSGSFTPAPGSPFSVGIQPRTIALKDINQDGSLDMMIPTGADGGMSVLLGSPTGSFSNAPGSPLTVGGMPYQCAINDFDLNGTLDAAVTTGTANSVVLFSGLGNGSFTVAGASPISMGIYPQTIASEDVDNDTKNDLIFCDWTGVATHVLLNKAVHVPPPPPPTGIEELRENAVIQFFPNPLNGRYLYLGTEHGPYQLKIFDVSGRLMLEQSINSGEDRLDTDLLGSGMYLIRMESPDRKIRAYRLIKDRSSE